MTPTRREIAVRVIAGLRDNLAWFGRYQTYLRAHRPPTLILWGPHDRYMPAAATANMAGIALGPPVGGILAEYAPHPLRLPFVIYLMVVGVVAVAISRIREQDGPPRRLRDVRLRPQAGVPSELRRRFLPPAITGFVIFALGGLYFALIPGVVARDLHQANVADSGAVVFTLGAVAVVVILLARRWAPTTAMTAGLILIFPAVVGVVAAQGLHSSALLFVAAGLAGATMALGYRGSLQVVNDLAPADRRAQVVSSYYIACFAGNSLPVIGLGLLTTRTRPLTGSAVFAGVIALLAIGALLGHRRPRRA